MLWQFYIQVHVITCYSTVPFKSTVQAVLCCVHHNVLQHMKFFSHTSNIKTIWDQTNTCTVCVSYWQLIEVCDICIPGIKFYQNIKPYIQIHFQMEIKPSTNSAAFIKKKKKSHPKMNELDRKTWIQAVSTLRPSKIF